jgi:hypothetical protein
MQPCMRGEANLVVCFLIIVIIKHSWVAQPSHRNMPPSIDVLVQSQIFAGAQLLGHLLPYSFHDFTTLAMDVCA